MACFQTLKQDIKLLEGLFPRSHSRFQIVSATVDELTCRFVGPRGEKSEIHANIVVSKYLYDPCELSGGGEERDSRQHIGLHLFKNVPL